MFEKLTIEIKRFLNSNTKLVYIAISSIILTITYWYTKDLPEYIPHTGPLYDWLGNLAQAYLGSFIFYILQIYYPKRKAYLNLKGKIAKCKVIVESHMKDLLDHLKDNKGYFEESKISYLDGTKQLYIEYIKERVDTIEMYCNKILAYQQYLDDELVMVITNIINCVYIDNFSYMYSNRNSLIMKNSKISDLKVGIAELEILLDKINKIEI